MAPEDGCKVETMIDRYDLASADPQHETLDGGLVARWQGTNGHAETGYRSLTAWFNKRLLKRVYTEHERDVAGVRIDTEYEILTGDEELRREELIDHLELDGIDAEGVLQDMVSWGTMRTHLLECLGASKKSTQAQTEWERNSIAVARDITREKAETALTSLSSKGQLAGIDDATIDVQITVTCGSCPTRVPLELALSRGYVCDTHSNSPSTPETNDI